MANSRSDSSFAVGGRPFGGPTASFSSSSSFSSCPSYQFGLKAHVMME